MEREHQAAGAIAAESGPAWDHTSDSRFATYYAQASASAATEERFRSIRRMLVRLAARCGLPQESLDVADIGCGAGTQALQWAEAGNRVHGLDVNAELIALAASRAAERGLRLRFEVGSATDLPWPDASMDVCLMPELLEHVQDWRRCLLEAARVVKPGGMLFVSTTNVCCPRQQEFELPLYSWYPRRVKHKYERLAVTTRPELVNYATYPAVHWFSFYQLRDVLSAEGFRCYSRFDLADTEGKSIAARLLLAACCRSQAMHFIGQVLTPYTVLVGVRERGVRH